MKSTHLPHKLSLSGQSVTIENWGSALLSAELFRLVGLLIYKKFENKIAYWV